jgi:hypothetical protein
VQSGAERAVTDENKPQQMVAKNARIQARCTGECTHASRGSVNAQGGTPHQFTVTPDAKQFFEKTRGLDIKSSWVQLVSIYAIVTVFSVIGGPIRAARRRLVVVVLGWSSSVQFSS